MGLGMGMPLLFQVERVNEIALTPVANVDVKDLNKNNRRVVAGTDRDGAQLDARLPGGQGHLDVALDQGARRRDVRLHQVTAQATAERRPHDSLARFGVEDQVNRLPDLVGSLRQSQPAGGVGTERDAPAASEKGLPVHDTDTSTRVSYSS